MAVVVQVDWPCLGWPVLVVSRLGRDSISSGVVRGVRISFNLRRTHHLLHFQPCYRGTRVVVLGHFSYKLVDQSVTEMSVHGQICPEQRARS